MMERAHGPLLGVVVALALTGCATVIEPSATTSIDSTSTTAMAPDGSRSELLARLDAELSALSERIISGDGEEDALRRIESLWATLRADLEQDSPELVRGFQAVVDLARTAVERRRPADADKARLNATALLEAAAQPS